MALDPELAEFLARIYELLRRQHQALFELGVKTRSLEMALNANRSFAKSYEQATSVIQTPELTKENELGIAVFDELIRQLRGNKPQTH